MKGHRKVIDAPLRVVVRSKGRIAANVEASELAASDADTIEVVVVGKLADRLKKRLRIQVWREA